MPLHNQPIHLLNTLLQTGQISSVELAQALLARIEGVDSRLNSFITLTPEQAMRDAERADAYIASNDEIRPLTGIPIGLKDNIMTAGVPTSCGSHALEGYVPKEDAAVVTWLKRDRAVLMGKLNMDEFAMGSSNETSYFRPVRNPWDIDRVPGGSSGGSAAAVAAGEVVAALGSDTGGSIRLPAAFCGVVGLRPSEGFVGSAGLFPYAPSLDVIGPLAKCVLDCALLLGAISGWNPEESSPNPASRNDCERLLSGSERVVKKMKLGLPREFLNGLDPEMEGALVAALRHFEGLGAEVVETSLFPLELGLQTYYALSTFEAFPILGAMFLENSPLLGVEATRRLELGAGLYGDRHVDLQAAQRDRRTIRHRFSELFDSADLIIGPTSAAPAFRLGEKDEGQMRLTDALTVPASLAGLPALSIPCGFTRQGLPLGLQIIGAPYSESLVLQAAYAYEQSTAWHIRCPEL